MTRARAIEEALRGLDLALNDEFCRGGRVCGPSIGQAWNAARAALSLPADAPPDEYRRGVEDAARVADKVATRQDDDPTPRVIKEVAYVIGREMARAIRALAPPAPSSAATVNVACVKCLAEHADDCPDRSNAPPPTTVEPTAHATRCACGHAHLGDADGEDSGCCLDSCPCQKWRPSVCGICGGDGWVYNKSCTKNLKCPACGGQGIL
jgi:hypothetical protein